MRKLYYQEGSTPLESELSAQNIRDSREVTSPMPFSSTCPHCPCKSLKRSKIRFFDLPLLALGFVPSRCVGCNDRFYRHRLSAPLQRIPNQMLIAD